MVLIIMFFLHFHRELRILTTYSIFSYVRWSKVSSQEVSLKRGALKMPLRTFLLKISIPRYLSMNTFSGWMTGPSTIVLVPQMTLQRISETVGSNAIFSARDVNVSPAVTHVNLKMLYGREE